MIFRELNWILWRLVGNCLGLRQANQGSFSVPLRYWEIFEILEQFHEIWGKRRRERRRGERRGRERREERRRRKEEKKEEEGKEKEEEHGYKRWGTEILMLSRADKRLNYHIDELRQF